jgi:predicted acylesterase/phospholipase RssA
MYNNNMADNNNNLEEENKLRENNITLRKVRHLVFSGGGPAGLINYGAAKILEKEKLWSLANIQSIYGCSIGAYIGIIISLGYEWEWLDDYFIKRPWGKVFALNAQNFMDAYEEKGLLGEKILLESLKPLLCAKDLNEHCTLKELYEFNKIDIHIFTTNINSLRLEKVDLSHMTHPDLSVIKALCMSTSYPLAFKPVCIGDDCFIDGGLLNNFPLNDCLAQDNCHPDDILAFKNIWLDKDMYKITSESSIIDYMILLTKKMQREICTEKSQKVIKNIVECKVEGLSNMSDWINAVATQDTRAVLIEQGEAEGKRYYMGLT